MGSLSPTTSVALRSLLVTINAFEGNDQLQMTWAERRLRDALDGFKNVLEKDKGHQKDWQLKKFDRVFTSAGWDEQGFRWFKDRIYIVHLEGDAWGFK